MRSLCEAYQFGIDIRNGLHETDLVTALEIWDAQSRQSKMCI